MIRAGAGEPLLLLHPIVCDERIWRHVILDLASDHDVIAPTALGHHGGNSASRRPVDLDMVVDDAERLLDRLDIPRAHLAGNSLGGWMALELARRGRALSVCALSPAGAWSAEWEDRQRVVDFLRSAVRDTRRGRRILPLLTRSARFRRWAMQGSAVHGDRVSREDFLAQADATIGCEIIEDLLAMDARLHPIDPAPCPITLAWSEHDHLFPVETYGETARQLIPGARFIVLPDVGHVPMLDDPRLVARTILASTAAAAKVG